MKHWSEQASELLAAQGFDWTITAWNGESIVEPPSPGQVEQLVDQAIKQLNTLNRDGTTPQWESGGLIVQRNGAGYDIYVHITSL